MKLTGETFLVTLKTGITMKLFTFKGSLTMDLVLDEDYKGKVSGKAEKYSHYPKCKNVTLCTLYNYTYKHYAMSWNSVHIWKLEYVIMIKYECITLICAMCFNVRATCLNSYCLSLSIFWQCFGYCSFYDWCNRPTAGTTRAIFMAVMEI